MSKRFIRTTSEIFASADKNLYLNSIVFIEDKLLIWSNDKYYAANVDWSNVLNNPIKTDGDGNKFLSDDGTYKSVTTEVVKFLSNTQLKFYCVEPVTVVVGEDIEEFPANSMISKTLNANDMFSIIPTSDNSILTLDAWPGPLQQWYSWLDGVALFSNIIFNMNVEELYVKWNQGHQGQYHVLFAQYKNCIFWSDLAYISDVSLRTNYTLYYSSEMPLCYSLIPDNTFKSFYLAYNATSDPNWSNPVYKESFSKATWATQVFSYYGMHSIGVFDMSTDAFNIVLPKDCRGLCYHAPNIRNVGVLDAINTTTFGAKSGSWRDAFADCTCLENLYIINLKTNLNISWSPIHLGSIDFIVNRAANTSKITISLSPYTYYGLSLATKELAASKNIVLELLATNYPEDKRLTAINLTGDGNSYLSNDGTYKSIVIPEIPSLDGYVKIEDLETLESNISKSLDELATKDTKLSGRLTTVENYSVPDARNKVLWVGTSIPAGDIQHGNNGTSQSITTDLGSNNYPKMVADALGFTLYNNARGSSFLCFYPSSEDGTDRWASVSDWQEYSSEVWKGYSLSASFAQVDEKFGPNGLNCPQWLINNFKSYSYESLIIPYIDGTLASCDTVVIDHGYNDRQIIINEASWHPGEGETQFATGAGRDWLLKLQDPFETTLEAETYFQGKWWNDESVSSKKHYMSALIFLAKKIWAVNPKIKIIIGNYFASKSNTFGAEFGNDRLAEFVNLANSACASWLRVNCVDVWKHTGIYNRNLPAGNDFQLFCPDGVHPHSDQTGHSNSIIAGAYINAIRGTLYI